MPCIFLTNTYMNDTTPPQRVQEIKAVGTYDTGLADEGPVKELPPTKFIGIGYLMDVARGGMVPVPFEFPPDVKTIKEAFTQFQACFTAAQIKMR